MPVTRTAKRALRSSQKKGVANKAFLSRFEIALRTAKRTKAAKSLREAVSLADRAAKKGLIHSNRAARIKSSLSALAPKPQKASAKKAEK